MKTSARPQSILFKIISVMILVTLSACAADLSGGAPQGDTMSTGEPPRLLGFIFDSAGQPVALAEVGGEDITTPDGVASGNFSPYEGGWIPVSALGYASGYARAHGEDQGSRFFETRLTPFQMMENVEGEDSVLMTGARDGISWTAELSGADFPGGSALVGIAAISPAEVDAYLAPFPAYPDLRLRGALALEAYDSAFQSVSLAPSVRIPLTLTLPSPLSEAAVMARFDLASGAWQPIDLGCLPLDENQSACQLDLLDPLIGIFDDPAAFASGLNPARGGIFAPAQAQSGDPFMAAWLALASYIKSQEGNPGGLDPNDPTLKKLVEDLADAARDHARNNRSEGGKRLLGKAIDAAMSTGQNALADALLEEMAEMSNEIGRKALNESDCGEFRRLLKAAQQIILTGGDEALAQQLTAKAGEMTKDCDSWDGKIEVWMRTANNHPAGLPMESQGGGMWSEYHQVQIWTNLDDNVMHGESKISLSFPNVTYIKEEPCKQEITMSGGGSSGANFEGTFDGFAFNVSSLTQDSAGGSIQQSWRFQKKEDDQCVSAMSQDYSFNPYYSIVLHGLSSESPPINYQEILDSAAGFATDTGIRRFGGNESFPNPDPDLGLYPFEQVTVIWNFFHTNHKLPLEVEP